MSAAGDATFNNNLYIPNYIYHNGDINTYIHFPADDNFQVVTAGYSRMLVVGSETSFNEDSANIDFRVESDANTHALFVDAGNNRVGIKESSPVALVDIGGTETDESLMLRSGDNNTASNGGKQILFGYNNTASYAHNIRTRHDSANQTNNTIAFYTWQPTQAAGAYGDARIADFSSNGVVFNEDSRNADFRIESDNNSNMFVVDASAEQVYVGKSGANSSVAGVVLSTSQSSFTRTDGRVALFNRQNDDGEVIGIGQQDITEGNISVSGSTVSYNGGHLSRWSRLLDNSKDTSIVKGTVMTNLDEMVEWGDEHNEQLNKMAVSSVEGDANVAGVFVNWDNDDDWNDMNVAMTGDMVIRIAQGTTVARGELLMSAGDGTAKPQGDDIVRSKTIAKVTSTNASHTYDDGTYLVPCVLMAC